MDFAALFGGFTPDQLQQFMLGLAASQPAQRTIENQAGPSTASSASSEAVATTNTNGVKRKRISDTPSSIGTSPKIKIEEDESGDEDDILEISGTSIDSPGLQEQTTSESTSREDSALIDRPRGERSAKAKAKDDISKAYSDTVGWNRSAHPGGSREGLGTALTINRWHAFVPLDGDLRQSLIKRCNAMIEEGYSASFYTAAKDIVEAEDSVEHKGEDRCKKCQSITRPPSVPEGWVQWPCLSQGDKRCAPCITTHWTCSFSKTRDPIASNAPSDQMQPPDVAPKPKRSAGKEKTKTLAAKTSTPGSRSRIRLHNQIYMCADSLRDIADDIMAHGESESESSGGLQRRFRLELDTLAPIEHMLETLEK